MSLPMLTPAERLVLSRERLRQALREISAPAANSKNATSGAWIWAWLSKLTAKPDSSDLVEAARKWWMQHPLHVAGELALDVTKAALQPLAQRHPIGLVLGAFALGGLLAWTRAWRPLLKPALWVGLLPQIWAKACAGMTSQSWLAVLASLAQFQKSPDPAAGSVRPDQSSASQSKD